MAGMFYFDFKGLFQVTPVNFTDLETNLLSSSFEPRAPSSLLHDEDRIRRGVRIALQELPGFHSPR